jgi:hypothetical protein
MSAPSRFIRFMEWVGVRSSQQEVVTFDDRHLFDRFAPFWPDEYIHQGKHHFRPPWWRPFNILLHCWDLKDGVAEELHDHPRWSVTVCLAGRIVEVTPWGERLLKPGSIVFRTRKAIHAFRAPEGYAGETWTLFIVGRRNHQQNTYVVTPQGFVTAD